MALRHAILGLLTEDRASGYALARRFKRQPWRYAWHAQYSQIHPELSRMVQDGLITQVAGGARGRKIYSVTRAGENELRTWLLNPPENFVVRSEFVLRVLLLLTLDPRDARALLAPIAAASAEEVATLRAAIVSADAATRPDAPPSWERLTAEFSLRSVEAQHGWAVWALAHLDRS
jgi:PadR family transcriptional regulator, regulatory protein AphA